MAEPIRNTYRVDHPAPHGHAVARRVLFGALLAGPVAWTAQLTISYGLSSYACFPRAHPLASALPGWGWVWPAALAINIAALAVAVAAIVVSFRSWQRASEEAPGGHLQLIESGEGRTRFLAVWGIWSGVWFAVGILFNTIGVLWVPLCGS